jgi:hypothetical protein
LEGLVLAPQAIAGGDIIDAYAFVGVGGEWDITKALVLWLTTEIVNHVGQTPWFAESGKHASNEMRLQTEARAQQCSRSDHRWR